MENERNRRIRDDIADAASREFAETCTFQPKLEAKKTLSEQSKFRLGLSDPDALAKRIARQRQEKERKLEEAKREREYKELEGCTFAPQISSENTVPKPSGPIIIKGFGRHLERQDQIKRMREEQQEREEKVFLTNAKGSRHVITRPQPFKLHQNFHAEERTKKMIEELRNREQEMYTFHPQTNEGKNREVLERVLQEHTEDDILFLEDEENEFTKPDFQPRQGRYAASGSVGRVR